MHKLFLFISIAIFFFTNNESYSSEYWAKSYGGSFEDRAGSIQATTDGGSIVAGYTESFGAGGFDMWVLKLNSSGDVIWQKTYGSSANDYADSVQQTTDGGYIIAGLTEGSVCVLKLDGSGNVIWQNKYGGSDYDVNSMQQTSDGGYILAGSFVFSSSYYNILPWIMKLTGNGVIVWQRFYPGSENLEPEGYVTSIFQTADNGYIAVGGTDPYGLFNNDVLVLKLSQSGYASWAKIYRGASSATATSIRQTEDGNYIVGGSNSYRYVSGDFSWIQKLNSSGITLWQKTYRGGGGDYVDSVQETEDGANIALGDTNSFGAGDFDMWILKVDDVGEIPYCDIIGTSTIDVYDAPHLPLNSDAMGQSIELTITDTNIIPQNTSHETSIICCYDSNDSDGDCIGDACDTDPLVYDPSQPDTYPPDGGNNCGDACECEGNFDDDDNQDGSDAAIFKIDFGRSTFQRPCTDVDPCNGDFLCDGDADGTDAAKFKEDFGRSPFGNPCPSCPTQPWCEYP